MKFQFPEQETQYYKCAEWIKELFGISAVVRTDAPGFRVAFGSACVEILVHATTDDSTLIHIRSYVVTDVELNQELMRFLLKRNGLFYLGGFGLEDDAVVYDYAFPAEVCTRDFLHYVVRTVGEQADRYDDEIVGRFGGCRARDSA